MKLSERLKIKVEKDLGITVVYGPKRIYGLKGAAHRWWVKTNTGYEYTCEDTMREAVKTEKLLFLQDGIHKYISIS